MVTFGSVMDERNGTAPGFDFLRLFLASCVLLWHCIYYTQDHARTVAIWNSPVGPLVNAIVPSFFALSGFLVTGSLERLNDLRTFLTFRALRILPALITEVLLSAIILGPIVTDLSLRSYFGSAEVPLYLTNIVGFIRYTLPGVFQHQYYDQVNGALWSVPGEMICYLSLAVLVLCRIGRSRMLTLASFAAATIGVYLFTRRGGAFSTQNPIPLVFCFYAGGVVYYYRHNVPRHLLIAVGAALLAYYVMYFRFGLYVLVGPTAIAYLTVYVGILALPRIKYLMDGDHSYGIYLYHSPIIQTFVWLSATTIKWWLLFCVAYPTVFLFAMFSWRYIEKPTLALRRRPLPRVLPRWISRLPDRPGMGITG
jgi:peptidoglycan/LPS O-acetylase OafA/YrhL